MGSVITPGVEVPMATNLPNGVPWKLLWQTGHPSVHSPRYTESHTPASAIPDRLSFLLSRLVASSDVGPVRRASLCVERTGNGKRRRVKEREVGREQAGFGLAASLLLVQLHSTVARRVAQRV